MRWNFGKSSFFFFFFQTKYLLEFGVQKQFIHMELQVNRQIYNLNEVHFPILERSSIHQILYGFFLFYHLFTLINT